MKDNIPPNFLMEATENTGSATPQENQLRNMKFPILILKKHDIHLRQQCKKDAPEFLKYYNNKQVNQFILAAVPKTLDEAAAELAYCRNLFYIARGLHWAITRNDNNKMIGAIGIYLKETPNVCEICYELNQDYWNQGIMSSSMKSVIHYLTHSLGITQIEALTLKENTASGHLLEKNGFHFSKTLKEHRLFNGKKYDVELYILNIQNNPE